MPKLSIFQTILLAVFGALAVSGVLIFAFVINNSASDSIGPVTIWGTFEENAFNSVIEQVAEADERFGQIKYDQKNAETYMADLTEALATGKGPDLFILRQDYAVRDAGKIYVTPYDQLSETEFRNTFIEAADPYLIRSGIVAIPLIADPLVLYWNRDMLSSVGYANPPRYWDEISGMAQKITKKNDSGQILKSTVSFGEYRNVTHAKDILSMLILQAGSPIVLRDESGNLTSALSSRETGKGQTTESAVRFYTEFADPSKVIYSWNRALPESRAAFSAGNLALYIGYASEQGEIAHMNPNLNFAVAPVPQIRTTDRPVDVARVYGLAITRTSRNLLGAVTVASRLASGDASAALGAAFGMTSARRDVLGANSTGSDDLSNTQAILSRAWADPDPEGTDDVFRAMIENVTSGTLRLGEAVSRAEQELAQLLRI